jgi:riboflavin synthase
MAGSWKYTFALPAESSQLVVDKGSICINGVSLTVVAPEEGSFSVAIIPYTYMHTNFHQLLSGNTVNIEFDILGKYISKYLAARFN